jgi:formamidopyrimidine-DNA glycosylase
MPELPDVSVYVERLAAKIVGERLERLTIRHPFLLRSVVPPVSALEGRAATGVERLGKRVVIAFEDELFLVVHLMIAGRLRWLAPGKTSAANALALFVFSSGTLALTEAGKQRRASLHVVAGRAALAGLDAGGIDVMTATRDAFAARLVAENHTVKRALTDPRLFSGIGNAYSDEILHAARLSPVKLTQSLSDAEIERLHTQTEAVLNTWTDRLRAEVGAGFPEKVTAFRPEMAVHGRFQQPCPVCGTKVQRIAYASNELNYCPTCQTGGKLLADRGLSRLMKSDWPKSLEELEELKAARREFPSK